MLKIINILMDYEEKLMGVTHVPVFSWKLSSDRKNVIQTAYRLQIAKDEAFETIIYDSGLIATNASAQITAEGISLASLQHYYVRVMVQDAWETSDWACTSFFTGLMNNSEWKSDFISAEIEQDWDTAKETYVRKAFTVEKEIKEAYLCSTALGVYHAYLNGEKIGNDEMAPGWTSYHKHLCYQIYDVTEQLAQGDNVIGAVLAPGWYKGYVGFDEHIQLKHHYGNRTAFLGQLLIRYTDGSEEYICTDMTWQGADSPVVFVEIYDGEIYDASKEIKDWASAACTYENWHAVTWVPYDKKVLYAQPCVRVEEIDTVPAKRIFKTPQGDTVIDFGQNMSARIEVKASGKKGDRIHIECFEVLDANGNVYTENLRHAKAKMEYIFGEDGEITYKPTFTWMGFQFAKIVEYPGEPKCEDFTAYTIHSNMQRTGWFECSNPDLNQLGHNILWGLKSNFIDIPTDCPQRDERMGWTGDAEIFCRSASYLMNTYNFYKKWLVDLVADQKPDGGVPHVIPDIMYQNMYPTSMWYNGTYGGNAWADVATILPWTLYLTFGDKDVLKDQYKSMTEWIRFMCEHAVDYVWDFGVQLSDWVALDAEEGSYFGGTPDEVACTAYFALSTEIVAKTAGVLGYHEDEAYYWDLYQKIKAKYQSMFWDEDGNMLVQTQTAHIISLYFGLVPEEYRAKTVEGLRRLIAAADGHLTTGFIGTPYICHALSQNGYVKDAYDLLLRDDFPSWLYQVKRGATTVWEHWDGLKPDGTMWSPNMNSFNHYAYGAICEWIVRAAAGIEIDEKNPGYKNVVITPHPGGDLTYMQAEYESVYGRIKSRWEMDGNKVTLRVQIPANTFATISLNGAKEVVKCDGLAFVKEENAYTAKSGSGEYVFEYLM